MGNHTSVFLTAGAIRQRNQPLPTLHEHLDHIREHNPRINAIVTLDENTAMQRADQISREPSSEVQTLRGVPVSVKDAWMVKGMRSTGGYPPLADLVPDEDATVVAKLREAGAIILGKTNVPILSTDTQTDNEIFGRTNNPWNLEHTPGGSSGGSAAAVSSGMSPLDIGSDVAGSVRIPAHYCGIYSLKPTEYRVSTYGHIPPLKESPRGIRYMSVAGPIARSIQDLAIALRVIAGPDDHLPEMPPVPLTPAESPKLPQLRVAWTDRFGHVPVTEDTSRVLEDVASKLADQGSTVEKRLPDGLVFPDVWEVFGEVYWGMVGASFAPEDDTFIAQEAGFVPDSADAFSRGCGRAVNASLRFFHEALLKRDQFVRALDAFLNEWDVLICPVAATPAIPHIPHMSNVTVARQEINYFEGGTYYCIPFSLTGHPVVVIPAGYSEDGLPIGVQLVGKRWDEMRLLAVAETIDAVLHAYRRPPGF